jgi:tetratricopeptide (TPR) repeat protein
MQLQCQVWLARGELSRAHAQASLSLEMSRANEVRWVADSHHILGLIAALRGQWQEAERCFKQALAVRLQVRAMVGAVDSTVALGRVYEESGDWSRAQEQYTEAVRLAREMDPGPKLVLAHTYLGRLCLRRGESALAAQLLAQAISLAETIPDTPEYAPALLAMAELHFYEGQPGAACELVERALEREIAIEHRLSAHCLLARLTVALGDPERGAIHVASAQQLAETLGSAQFASVASLAAGSVVAARGDARGALTFFQAAANEAETAGAPYHLALAIRAQVEQLAQLDEQASVPPLLARLAEIRDQLGIERQGALPATLATAAPS